MSSDRDADDWAAAMAGDGDAFGRVFDRREAPVRRQVARVLTSSHDVEDAVAIVFLELWRNRASVRLVDDSLLPWLLVTAMNVARNVRRAGRRYGGLLAQLPHAQDGIDPASLFDDGDMLTALRRLSHADQQVLALCVLEQLSEREAATALHVRPGTVKSRLHRAKRRLADQFALLSVQPSGGPTHGH